MDKRLNLNGVRIDVFLPEKGREFPYDDFTGISVSVDDGGHAQGEFLSVEQTTELAAFLNDVMALLKGETK